MSGSVMRFCHAIYPFADWEFRFEDTDESESQDVNWGEKMQKYRKQKIETESVSI